MVEYPRDQAEVEGRFGEERACRAFLSELRWPGGFVCPACGGHERWETTRGLWMCRGCGRQVSVTAGTIFHRSHIPLTTWFRAAWWVTCQKNGASALGLQRSLGIRNYQSAWHLLHRLRRAMVRADRKALDGEVEVDETFVGGFHPGTRGREVSRKALVAIAVECRGEGSGRIRLRRVADSSAESLVGFVEGVVAAGSAVTTDGLATYLVLPTKGFRHVRRVQLGATSGPEVLLPRVHRVASLLKRWLLGTHQGGVHREHIDAYLEEFSFRFNRRTSRSRGLLFLRLMENAVRVAPLPYERLVSRRTGRGPKPQHKT